MNVTITEHTTTDDTFCTVRATGTDAEGAEFYGTAEEFIQQIAAPRGWTWEVVWS